MTQQPVKVRFAPSPTGYLHVGGLRTALYNYLFARKHGGTAVLRIEDTDRSRYVEGAVESLIASLEWAGLYFDEGPTQGGDTGPYVQSERTDLYREHVTRLLDEGKAYRCFCTPEELEDARARQQEEHREQAYDRRCRSLTEEDIRTKLKVGTPYTVRMKVPLAGELQFPDLIRGDIAVHYDVIDDQVLLKSDGFPTYHLANVVDDHAMGITHVIRGEEWLPSTVKHLLLYEFFGWAPPQMAHLPLLLNQDRSKLSKRQGDVAVEDYREKGFLPEALVNFVALLGWNPGDDREMFTLEELEREFSLERVGKAGAVFDMEKLRWFNSQYVRHLPAQQLAALCAPWLDEAGIAPDDVEQREAVVTALSGYLTFPSDIAEHLSSLVGDVVEIHDEEAQQLLAANDSQSVLQSFITLAGTQDDWSAPEIKALIKRIQKETGIKGKALFMPLRLALTGAEHGPDLGLLANLIGKESAIARVQAWVR